MTAIRRMEQGDLVQVREIDAAAFGAWHRRLKGRSFELPGRRPVNLLALLGKDPEGCFVAETGGRLAGFIFSRTWGSEGWFGTFAVLPECQGQGIGKQLIAASMGYLRGGPPGRVVGLETMAESAYNLGLYSRLGFQVHSLTFLMAKPIGEPSRAEPGAALWSSAGPESRGRWIADLREMAGLIRPGLDYTKEILSTAGHGLGETLILTHGPKAVGMSVVWEVSVREGMDEDQAAVQVMALHPVYATEENLHALLDGAAAYARSLGKRMLAVPVNSGCRWVLGRMLDWDYRVDLVRVRMVWEGSEVQAPPERAVNCARWLA